MSLVSAIEPPAGVASAIRKASVATGTDFGYLLQTAARESSFQNEAKAKTSSAAGLFQFIENTWLQTVKEEGGRFGLDKYTPHIFRTRGGRYYVPDDGLRSEILQLRYNPEVSAMMAGAFTRQNAETIQSEIGRQPTQGELYIAHFLGPTGAARLISMSEENPDARADQHFPQAAKFNRGIFYARGKPRSVEQVYNARVSDHGALQTMATGTSQPAVTSGATPQEPARAAGAEAMPLPARKPQSARPIKVAALNTPSLRIPQTASDAPGMGGIGTWTTIVKRTDGVGKGGAKPEAAAAGSDRSGVKHAAGDQARPMRLGKAAALDTSARLQPRRMFRTESFSETAWIKQAFESP